MVKIDQIELPHFPLLLAPMEDVSDPPSDGVQRAWCRSDVHRVYQQRGAYSRCRQKQDEVGHFRVRATNWCTDFWQVQILTMVKCAEIIEAVNPYLLDINYGCPVMKVTCKGAGAGILKVFLKMVSMTEAIVKATKLPVTVKTRLGWDDSSKNIVEVAERLQDIGIKALTVHGRTRVQMYKGKAD
jgi:tRNA-dihydrouridine synthase